MSESKSRRSFFVDLLSTAAGLLVAVTGGVAVTTASGCDTSADYGGPSTVDQAVAKYGGPPDAGVDCVAGKYGGPADAGAG